MGTTTTSTTTTSTTTSTTTTTTTQGPLVQLVGADAITDDSTATFAGLPKTAGTMLFLVIPIVGVVIGAVAGTVVYVRRRGDGTLPGEESRASRRRGSIQLESGSVSKVSAVVSSLSLDAVDHLDVIPEM